MGEVLPFALVCAAVAGLTVALFGVPRAAPAAAPPRAETPFPSASARRMDEAMTRAIAALKAARNQTDSVLPAPAKAAPPRAATPGTSPSSKAPRASSAAPLPAAGGNEPAAPPLPAPGAPETSAPVMTAVTSLSEAVKAVRGARTEQDFVRAEEQMRAVRAQMQAACAAGTSSAFCDSAREMNSLGY